MGKRCVVDTLHLTLVLALSAAKLLVCTAATASDTHESSLAAVRRHMRREELSHDDVANATADVEAVSIQDPSTSTTTSTAPVIMPGRTIYGSLYLSVAESMSAAFVESEPHANGEGAIKKAIAMSAKVQPEQVHVTMKCNFGCKLLGDVSWLESARMSNRTEAKFSIEATTTLSLDTDGAVQRLKDTSEEKLGTEICTLYNALVIEGGGLQSNHLDADVSLKVESRTVTSEPAPTTTTTTTAGNNSNVTNASNETNVTIMNSSNVTNATSISKEEVIDIKFKLINFDVVLLTDQKLDEMKQLMAAAFAAATSVSVGFIHVYVRQHVVGSAAVLLEDFIAFAEHGKKKISVGALPTDVQEEVKFTTTVLPVGTGVDKAVDVNVLVVVPADRLPSAVVAAVSTSQHGAVAISKILEELKNPANDWMGAVKNDIGITPVETKVNRGVSVETDGEIKRPLGGMDSIPENEKTINNENQYGGTMTRGGGTRCTAPMTSLTQFLVVTSTLLAAKQILGA